MPRGMRWKWILIACVLLGCVIGVIRLLKSKDELVANWKRNMRLGLDLKGGSHIAMQVQVQDAFKIEADRAMELLNAALKKAGISFGAIERNDPDSVETAETIQIAIKGVQPDRAAELRRIADEVLSRAWTALPDDGAGLRLGSGSLSLPRPTFITALPSFSTMSS